MARFASQKRHTTSIMHRFKFRLTCRAKDALFMHRAIMSSMDQVLLLCPRPLISLYVSIWASPLDLWYPRPRFRAWTGGGDREAGSWQSDALQSHEHDIPTYAGISGTRATLIDDKGNLNQSNITLDVGRFYTYPTGPSGRIAAESRPVNISVPAILYLGLPA